MSGGVHAGRWRLLKHWLSGFGPGSGIKQISSGNCGQHSQSDFSQYFSTNLLIRTKAGPTTHPNQEVSEAVVMGLAENLATLGKPLCPCRFYPNKAAEAKHRTWRDENPMELFGIQLLIGDGLYGTWQKGENVNENLGHHDTLCQG